MGAAAQRVFARDFRNGCLNDVVSNVNLPRDTKNPVFMSIHKRMGDACDRVEEEERTITCDWNQGRGRASHRTA